MAMVGFAGAWTRTARSSWRDPFRVGLIGSADNRGLTLGMEEGVRSSALFGHPLAFERETVQKGPVEAARRLLERPVHLLISTLSSVEEVLAVSETANAGGRIILNAASSSDALRAGCRSLLFHVAASETMTANALASHASVGVTATMWDADLERFGAGQLNARFHTRFRASMTGNDWAAWMSIKIAVECWLRANATDTGALRAYLEREDTRFDGHKGVPLAFRTGDHQLLQPLYVAAGDGVIHQVPSSSGAGDQERAQLDSLGGRVRARQCG
jgi:hypothetical protein